MCAISVIIPVYNTEKYLFQCVDSILGQRVCREGKAEIILIDDGSIDHSKLICEGYAKEYGSIIRTVHIDNTGPAQARKIGIEVSNGQYIVFADSDDYFPEHAIDIMYEKALQGDFDILCGNYERKNDKKRKVKKGHALITEKLCMGSEEAIRRFFMERDITGSLCSKIYKKELFKEIDFCKDAIVGEDINLVLQLLEKSGYICVIPDVCYTYRVNGSGISRMGYTQKHANGLRRYIEMRQKMCVAHPKLRVYIIGFFSEYELSPLTAMCRNQMYDWDTIEILRCDLKKNLKEITANVATPFYLKICAWMIANTPRLFICSFRLVHIVTGR